MLMIAITADDEDIIVIAFDDDIDTDDDDDDDDCFSVIIRTPPARAQSPGICLRHMRPLAPSGGQRMGAKATRSPSPTARECDISPSAAKQFPTTARENGRENSPFTSTGITRRPGLQHTSCDECATAA